MQARIMKIISKSYTLAFENGETAEAYLAGKIRLKTKPVAGDLVEAEQMQGQWVVQSVYPRTSYLIRPACANVDQALIVMSVKDPDFSCTLIDRLSFLIRIANITPVLIVTKCDLGIPEDVERKIQEYENGPMLTLRSQSAYLNEELAKVLDHKISVLTGQSGAGKSTLLNKLDPTFHLATQEISKALGRGKHTTRHNELHRVGKGLVADTPGFSSLSFDRITPIQLASSVAEFQPYLNQCKYNDCIHQNEPDCAIKKAVEEGKIPQTRYTSYLEILRLIQNAKVTY